MTTPSASNPPTACTARDVYKRQVIISEADRMTRIVQDLLTLSKIDYGKMEMNISRFPFLKSVQNVYDAAKLNAEPVSYTHLLRRTGDEVPAALSPEPAAKCPPELAVLSLIRSTRFSDLEIL